MLDSMYRTFNRSNSNADGVDVKSMHSRTASQRNNTLKVAG